jgi:pyruvate,water dikinase
MHELPSLLWSALRTAALAAAQPAPSDEIDERTLQAVRNAVPAQHHRELDALIAEARATASLRDERALYSDVWAWGILRTVVLHIARRLIRRSPKLLADPTDLVHASRDEILSLLLRSQGPSAAALAERAAHVRSYTIADAPPHLGPPAFPPPPAELLPPGGARVTRAIMAVMPHMLPPPKERRAEAVLRGWAASGGQWEGPAHLVNSHDDAKAIPAGAVLVVGAGSSSFTMLAPLASAVVAEGGGLLSHVAIVCREYRIPCVCGCPGVLSSIKTGQRLRVDGTHGTVEVLSTETAAAAVG